MTPHEVDAHRAREDASVLASRKGASSPSSPCSAHAVPACACARLRVAPTLPCSALRALASRPRGRWADGASGGGPDSGGTAGSAGARGEGRGQRGGGGGRRGGGGGKRGEPDGSRHRRWWV